MRRPRSAGGVESGSLAEARGAGESGSQVSGTPLTAPLSPQEAGGKQAEACGGGETGRQVSGTRLPGSPVGAANRRAEFRSPLLRSPLPACRLALSGLRSPAGCLRATEPGLRTAATRPLDCRGAEFRSERRGGERGTGAPETGPEGRSSAFGGRSSPGGRRKGGPEGRRGGVRRPARRGSGERMSAEAEGWRADLRRGVESGSQAGVRGPRTPGCRGVESVPRGPRRPAVPCGSP